MLIKNNSVQENVSLSSFAKKIAQIYAETETWRKCASNETNSNEEEKNFITSKIYLKKSSDEKLFIQV